MSRAVALLGGRVGLVVPAVVAVGLAVFALGAPGSVEAERPDEVRAAARQSLGAELFRTQCSSCHGLDGLGVPDRGPSLAPEGEASADFVLRTGRMPIAAPDLQARSGPVRYSEEEIVALVAYVGEIGDGPDIPDVDASRGDETVGGELYRLNCAACHVASGAGAPIGGGRHAPNVVDSTDTEIGEAILVGPGAMPVFGSLDADDLDDIAAYVRTLEEEGATSATSFGGAGPVAEGLAAFILGLIPLVALTRWIGAPKDGRDHPVDDDEELDELAHPIEDTEGADAVEADIGEEDEYVERDDEHAEKGVTS